MKHFENKEVACRCCGAMPEQAIMDLIDQIREDFGRPITISSCKRCEKRNKEVSGAPKSLHVQGLAVDFVRSPELLKFLLPKLEHYKICMEDPEKTPTWIHIDLLSRRGYRVFKI